MKCADFFNRCTYDAYDNGVTVPKRRSFIMRNYGGGDNIIDATQEMIMDGWPDGYALKRVYGSHWLPEAIEIVSPKGITTRFCNFTADPDDYTMDYLVKHPDLLGGSAEEFIAFYAGVDERKKGCF